MVKYIFNIIGIGAFYDVWWNTDYLVIYIFAEIY